MSMTRRRRERKVEEYRDDIGEVTRYAMKHPQLKTHSVWGSTWSSDLAYHHDMRLKEPSSRPQKADRLAIIRYPTQTSYGLSIRHEFPAFPLNTSDKHLRLVEVT